jgi:hypothetical protein
VASQLNQIHFVCELGALQENWPFTSAMCAGIFGLTLAAGTCAISVPGSEPSGQPSAAPIALPRPPDGQHDCPPSPCPTRHRCLEHTAVFKTGDGQFRGRCLCRIKMLNWEKKKIVDVGIEFVTHSAKLIPALAPQMRGLLWGPSEAFAHRVKSTKMWQWGCCASDLLKGRCPVECRPASN